MIDHPLLGARSTACGYYQVHLHGLVTLPHGVVAQLPKFGPEPLAPMKSTGVRDAL